jgi:hypothetical protein
MLTLSHVHQLFSLETCQTYIHALRWKDRPLQCPRCQSQEVDPWGKYPNSANTWWLFRTVGDMSYAGILREGPRVTRWNMRLSCTVIQHISDIISQTLCNRPPC